MPLTLTWAACLALGAALAHATRTVTSGQPGTLSWPLWALGAFASAVVVPVCTYFARFYPAYATLYLFDPQRYPRLAAMPVALCSASALAHAGALFGAYVGSRTACGRGRPVLAALPLGVAGALTLATLLAGAPRLLRVSDFDTFWAGAAPTVLTRPPLYVALAAGAAGLRLWAWARRRAAAPAPRG